MKATLGDDIAILVVSCDAYRDLWNVFFPCFFKYWPDCPFPLFLGSNTRTYPDHRVTAIPVGADRDYSTNLLAMLAEIRQERLIFWIEDRVLSRPVSTSRLLQLSAHAQARHAASLKLIPIHPFASRHASATGIGIIPRGTPYRVSMTVALWDKRVLQSLLRAGESAWEIEYRGAARADEMAQPFLAATRSGRADPPIQDRHLIIKGRLARDARHFLARENLSQHVAHRPIQSFHSHLYTKAVLKCWDLCGVMHWRQRNIPHAVRSSNVSKSSVALTAD